MSRLVDPTRKGEDGLNEYWVTPHPRQPTRQLFGGLTSQKHTPYSEAALARAEANRPGLLGSLWLRITSGGGPWSIPKE